MKISPTPMTGHSRWERIDTIAIYATIDYSYGILRRSIVRLTDHPHAINVIYRFTLAASGVESLWVSLESMDFPTQVNSAVWQHYALHFIDQFSDGRVVS